MPKKGLPESIPHIRLEKFEDSFDGRAVLVEVPEQQPAFQRGHEHPGTGQRVALGELVLAHASCDDLLKGANQLRHSPARRVTKRGISVVAFHGKVHNRAAIVTRGSCAWMARNVI